MNRIWKLTFCSKVIVSKHNGQAISAGVDPAIQLEKPWEGSVRSVRCIGWAISVFHGVLRKVGEDGRCDEAKEDYEA